MNFPPQEETPVKRRYVFQAQNVTIAPQFHNIFNVTQYHFMGDYLPGNVSNPAPSSTDLPQLNMAVAPLLLAVLNMESNTNAMRLVRVQLI